MGRFKTLLQLLIHIIIFIVHSYSAVKAYGVHEQIWFEIVRPKNVSYVYKILPARDFGGILERPFQSVKMVATEPDHACSKLLVNGENIRGNVAFIIRGGCSFVTKVVNAELYGAIAAIIADNQDNIEGWINMIGDGTGRNNIIGIPVFYLVGKNGYMIRNAIKASKDPFAIINLPVNVTESIPFNQPPWDYW